NSADFVCRIGQQAVGRTPQRRAYNPRISKCARAFPAHSRSFLLPLWGTLPRCSLGPLPHVAGSSALAFETKLGVLGYQASEQAACLVSRELAQLGGLATRDLPVLLCVLKHHLLLLRGLEAAHPHVARAVAEHPVHRCRQVIRAPSAFTARFHDARVD